MKEVAFAHQGAKPTISTVERPKPADDQILVKSLWTAMNPVDAFVANFGLNVASWPAGLGADASGIVIEAGEKASSTYGFKVGDYVCGCTRIGDRQYSTCREFFLMDAAVTMRKPHNLSVAEAATIGAACQTAAFGLFSGLKIPLPGKGDPRRDSQSPDPHNGPWVLVMGGSGSVGRAVVQLARASGCQVISTCSKRNVDVVKQLGARACLDYALPLEEQMAHIDRLTSGAGVTKIFDATSADDPKLAKALFERYDNREKLFATTNDWTGFSEVDFHEAEIFEIHLGNIGKPDAKEINASLEKWDPILTSLYEAGKMVPMPYKEIGKGGLESALEAYGQKADGKKVVVHIQDE